MSEDCREEITQVLQSLRTVKGGDRQVTDWLFTVLYEELRSIADRMMRRERAGHTLQPTALVNEAYAKLVGKAGLEWENRAHFLAISARAMRQVLVDYARHHNATKRASGGPPVTITENVRGKDPNDTWRIELDVLALDDALSRLRNAHERVGRVVELKMFGAMKVADIAYVLAVSERTVANDWSFARSWLSRELGGTA
jgi:RNA polymerase sigma-70 factor (ECF subfamily)